MAPRGLSVEEKRIKLLEIFHETKDFYQLKELEKLGPKLKGIVSQSVKEVLQSLVDDGLVQYDKIGASNFYWSFPSQRGAIMQAKLSTAQDARESCERQIAELRASVEAEKALRPETEDRAKALEQLASVKKDLLALEKELCAYGECDPIKMEEKQRAIVLAKEAAVRWTAYFTQHTASEASEIRKYLGVEDDYEDIC